jgi:RNA polymerase sigma factor FliA
MEQRRSPSSGGFQRQKVILLLAQRIAQLRPMQKKVLAMYYHQNMQLAEIGDRFGMSEARIWQILMRTLSLLRDYVLRTTLTSPLKNNGKKGN